VQYVLKIQLDVELAVNTLQKAQKAMKEHLSTLQNEIAMGYGLLGKDEHDNQDNTTFG
jgi:chaperonin cofactor prefoldin